MKGLESVLNDKDAMAQISELAKMLGGSDNAGGGGTSAPTNESAAPAGGGGLSSLLSGGQNETQGLSPQMMIKLSSVIQAANRKDKNIDLLYALKPMLSEEKQLKIDRLIGIFRLLAAYPALKESGLLGGDGLGFFR